MTEYGAPFDGVLTGDASVAPYSAAEWARMWKLRHGAGTPYPNYGVFAGSGGGTYQPLEVRATSVISSNVDVQVGAALIDGRFYETTAVKTLAINANSSGNPRIDTIILRLDYAGQTIRLAVKQGTAAASPVRPSMQQDTVYWEIPLADVAVANGFSTLAQSTISQRQRTINTQSVGWQVHAYPQNYAWGATIGSGVSVPVSGTILIPYVLSGNLLLERVRLRVLTISVAYQYGWDLYIQDTNDGNTAENTIRRVAQSNGDASGTLAGSPGDTLSLAALGAPVPLTPGIYWLAWQNRHASNAITLDGALGNAFDVSSNLNRSKVTTNPNGATLDVSLAAGWLFPGQAFCVRLMGRVFGETTAS